MAKQTSFLAEPTTADLLRAEAARRAARRGNDACDIGLFGDGACQTDLVDMARAAASGSESGHTQGRRQHGVACVLPAPAVSRPARRCREE